MLTMKNKKAKLMKLLEGIIKEQGTILNKEVIEGSDNTQYVYNSKMNDCEGYSEEDSLFTFQFTINDKFFRTLNFEEIIINDESFSSYFEWYGVEEDRLRIMINYLSFLRDNEI